jgi:5-hydroxyisourate hydrolase
MSAITTHVLDISIGRPASGIAVKLDRQMADGGWEPIGISRTDGDGRASDLVRQKEAMSAGVHRLTFDVGQYFGANKIASFYPEVAIVFRIDDAAEHYHVPLLLSPFGYSTYRGS